MIEPSVSVVVPTYNRLPRLRRVLAALAAQTYEGRMELVVVSDGSQDGTNEYLRHAAIENLTFVAQPNSGPAAARNTGLHAARGSIVLFIDDDVVATPRLVEEHVKAHAEARTVVIGPMITPADHRMSPWVRWEQEMLYKQYDAMLRGDWEPTYRQFYTGNASAPRASLVELGGFDTTFRRAEDVELAYRMAMNGHRFVFRWEAGGYHYAERSFANWLAIASDYGRNDVLFGREHGRQEILDIMASEYRSRGLLVRAPARLAASVPAVATGAAPVLKSIAVAADRVGASAVARAALSSLYSMTYYRAAAAALGGSRSFRHAMAGRPATSETSR